MVRSAANDQLPVITQLVPVVLQKLNEVAQRMQAAESGTPVALEPNVSAQMEADGITKDQIPQWMGGGNKGISTKDYLEQLIQETASQ